MATVEAYLALCHTQLEEKAKDLYKEEFILSLRVCDNFHERDDSMNSKVYFKSRVMAEMKKSVSYCVDIVTNHGTILEAQCECPVGMGPSAHCKHVQCTLYGLFIFTNTKVLRLRQTCTQKLQSFHKVKSYKGSPLLSSQLHLRKSESKRSIRKLSTFDPRPKEYIKRPKYQEEFVNKCINFQATHLPKKVESALPALGMPILQVIPPANAYATAHDHRYLEKSAEQSFLEDLGVENLSDGKREQIEENTCGQSKNQTWYKERCYRLQSSNFGRICKATEKTDFTKLATSLTTVKELCDVAAIRHGLQYESVAIAEYEKRTSFTTSRSGIVVSRTHNYIACSPDGIVNDSNETIVEVKCPYKCRDMMISPVTVPYLINVNGELTLNKQNEYFYQVQGQLFCTECNFCDFVVYTFKDIKIIRIARDEKFISAMISKLELFYEQYFKHSLLDKFFYKMYDKYTFEYSETN